MMELTNKHRSKLPDEVFTSRARLAAVLAVIHQQARLPNGCIKESPSIEGLGFIALL